MKLLFIADGRSPTALNWISYFVRFGHSVHLVSMYACQPDLGLESLTLIPAAFSGASTMGRQETGAKKGRITARVLRTLATPEIRTWLRHHFVPRSLPPGADVLADLIRKIQPDLVHAMRIPYEGMLASMAYGKSSDTWPPLVVSVWGNDFSLHAPTTRRMANLTRQTMRAAFGLHTDCVKDQRLARDWGFESAKPAIVLPGAGGIQMDTFYSSEEPPGAVVINPRGLRVYVRNDTFFKAIPRVLAVRPETRFICPAMAGQPEAERWVQNLNIENVVTLLPYQSRDRMADLYRQAKVVVSPSTHDGTPNTLLEAMACGCVPVAGDIESLREWITPGENGLLVDPGDPQALAEAILKVLDQGEFVKQARESNQVLIRERAAYRAVMEKAEAFYEEIQNKS